MIQQQAAQHAYDLQLLLKIDRLTDFCDRVSFDFCFEKPVEKQVEVFTRFDTSAKSTALRYQIRENEITLDPWPLNVAQYAGYLVGYQLEGYPERLDSLIIPYHLHPLSS